MIDSESESGEWGEASPVISNFPCSCNLPLVPGVEPVPVSKNSLLATRCGGHKFT